MKLSMSQITTMPLALADDLPAFAAAGFSGVELQIDKVNRFVATASVSALVDLFAELKLKPTGATGLAPDGPALLLARGQVLREYLCSLRQQIELCRSLGVDHINIGADASRCQQEDNWQAKAIVNVREAAKLADDNGVRISLEFMSLGAPIGPFILETLSQTREIVAEADRRSVGYSIDFFHHYRSGATAGELESISPTDLVGVHVTDIGPGKRPDLRDSDRLLPGEGVAPILEYRDALLRAGFDGYWTLELLNEKLWKMDAYEVSRLGMSSMKAFGAASART